ncbi:hypothetical protein GCM10023219_10940 [Stakelama sediminis]|uniref:CysZ protein n=1 Tax=Stakelama sediminis TaxID=463200 RepID=A0A840YVZ4_9SPHN|nr:J domain-containing protein [Stakelama sediminis]MBB5717818.1 CysZ protein [Stakelama sediminis]
MFKLLLLVVIGFLVWRYLRKVARPTMPRDEAQAILGVSADADTETIRAAHRRLVSAVHPDRGGSAELTRRINIARDTLLRR